MTTPAREGLPEPLTFRFLSEFSRGVFVWSRWFGMDEFHHYGDDGELVQGPSKHWTKVEYAYPLDALAAIAGREAQGHVEDEVFSTDRIALPHPQPEKK